MRAAETDDNVGAAGTTQRHLGAKLCKDALRRQAVEFCLQTGMHGYKYIAQPGKHGVERVFWVVAVAVSMVAAVWTMLFAYDFNQSHRTLLAVDTTHHPLWRVHVPAVTVCPSNKVLRSRAAQLISAMRLPDGVTEEDALQDMAKLVEIILPRAVNTSNLERLQAILDANKMSVDQVMWMVSPSCDELLVKCRWKRKLCSRCSDLFRKVRTSYGYCCSFNYLDREQDTIKTRTHAGGCVGTAPGSVQRLSACGSADGLSMAVYVQPSNYFASIVPSYSVMVLLHSALQFPDESAHTKVIGTGTISLISYVAEVTEATDRLRRSLDPRERKCLFSDETYLPMYRNFTFGNCMASCKANMTMEVCGCFPITFPHVLNRKLCNLLDVPCQAALFSPTWPVGRKPLNVTSCPRCKATCEHVQYIVKSSTGGLNWTTDPGNYFVSGMSDRNASEYAIVHVYARRSITTRNKMDRHLLTEDLLGSLGGLSGLFVGFSLVAGFECVYFFTIRPCFRTQRGINTASSTPWNSKSSEEKAHQRSPAGRISPFVLVPPRILALRADAVGRRRPPRPFKATVGQ
ncbi:sodium channel protein Nach-like [Thrips palmi]|uniref:Sodium channel protein Nach-like n=1 Tax=Thrips palmi TaxID=161013 RepID=A0A6P8Y6R0_THRPL|nr:sodium channel protein Nach-like [Thrips palmi]